MEISELYELDTELKDLDIEVPPWIEQDISTYQVASILRGGCASSAYMPAVTHYQANETMAKHGDAVLQYIEDCQGELPGVPRGES